MAFLIKKNLNFVIESTACDSVIFNFTNFSKYICLIDVAQAGLILNFLSSAPKYCLSTFSVNSSVTNLLIDSSLTILFNIVSLTPNRNCI